MTQKIVLFLHIMKLFAIISLEIFASIGNILAVLCINIANKHTKIENDKQLLET